MLTCMNQQLEIIGGVYWQESADTMHIAISQYNTHHDISQDCIRTNSTIFRVWQTEIESVAVKFSTTFSEWCAALFHLFFSEPATKHYNLHFI